MGYYYLVYVLQVCLFLVVAEEVLPSSSESFISGDVLRNHRSSGRNLLQVLRECPLSFEFANYTILTSKCKGPEYLKSLCCPALGEFACPYAILLNDPSYNCASSMFNYIEQKGFPRGLFSSECRQDIPCPADSPSPAANDDNANAASLLLRPQNLLIFMLLFFGSTATAAFFR